MPATHTSRPERAPSRNIYPGPCTTCGQTVAAQAGLRSRRPNGSGWNVRHETGACPTPAIRTPDLQRVATAPASPTPNQFAASCSVCGHEVAALEGVRTRRPDGTWDVHHVKECPQAPQAPAPSQGSGVQITVPGIYVMTSGNGVETFYRARRRNGRWTCRRGVVTRDGTRQSGYRIIWLNAWRAIFDLRPEHIATAEWAAAFGEHYGICCACAADLENERSVALGYGPVCARRYGWPVPY